MTIDPRNEITLLVFPNTAKFGDSNILLVRTAWCRMLNMWCQSQGIRGITYGEQEKGPKQAAYAIRIPTDPPLRVSLDYAET